MKLQNILLNVSVIGVFIISSCSSGDKSMLKGEFLSSNGETIYLEHRALGGIEVLDSAKINKNGAFSFKFETPANPEFYQLRVLDKILVLTMDGEDNVTVSGDLGDINNTFTVENSPENEQLRTIDSKTINIKKAIDELEKEHSSKSISDVDYINSIDSVLDIYKSDVSKIILGNPSGAAAYYAIFQKINDYLIFDPYSRKDYSMYGAVATSWDRYYEGTTRTKHLHEFTMNALKTRKQQEKQAALIENATVMTGASLPDITLKNIRGENISLSSLKDKVVVLDFTVYNSEFSPKHNIYLNSIYKDFKAKGVEIYQISFDSDVHFWKNAASNLPWVTVHEPESVYSKLLSTYNVRDLPTAFVINKSGDVVSRIENYNTLAEEIKKVM